jgi:1-acyl-sn-glycerol-3-phosphate acyltransferase
MLTHLVPGKKGQHAFIIISRIWMRVWLFLVACPIKIKGLSNFKEGETYIVTCNHNSLMDVPLSCPFIPGANRTIAKSSFTKIPLFGWFYAKGAVLVDRNNEESRRRSFAKMKQTINEGIHMCIYPEGTRNRTTQPLKNFYDGAFKLAVETGTDVIPTVILNTKKVLPTNKFFYFMPHTLEMHFLSPISAKGKSVQELKESTYKMMWEYIRLASS